MSVNRQVQDRQQKTHCLMSIDFDFEDRFYRIKQPQIKFDL